MGSIEINLWFSFFFFFFFVLPTAVCQTVRPDATMQSTVRGKFFCCAVEFLLQRSVVWRDSTGVDTKSII